ncbi:hypothetical protein ABH924_003732 [Arthrobacter sp. GAS37]|uniref:chemotaxis protein n=1 Tax=Arthrobacter sp. GAS37 TaxID=3156261 RepID=UPI003838D1C5
MIFLAFIAGFLAISILSWAVYALTHPVVAGQGVLIFLCKAIGVIAVLVGIGAWIGHPFINAVPAALVAALAFIAANRLEARWRSW